MGKLCLCCYEPMNEVWHLGVLIDICPHCHGVWLDPGELEKMCNSVRAMLTAESADTIVYETSRTRSWDGAENEHPVDDRQPYDEASGTHENCVPSQKYG